MTELNLAAYDYVLKYQMLGPVQKQFADKIVFLNRIKRTMDHVDFSGRKVLTPVLINTGQSVGARSDGGALPTADSSEYSESQAVLRHNYATLRVTGPTIRASRKNSAAFAKAVTSEMENKTLALQQDIERQFFGWGKGFMAQTTGAASGQTIVFDNPGVKYLKKGMVCDIVTAAGVEHATDVTISAIDKTTNTVTFTGTLTSVVENDYIVRQNAYGIEMMGLIGITDDDTLLSSLQSIDSGTTPDWQGKVYRNGGTLRDLTLKIMQDADSYAEEEMGGKPSIKITSFALRDKYAMLLQDQKRFMNTMKLDGGFEAVEHNGVPLLPVPYCWPNKMFFINESALEIGQIGDFAWADEDGSVLHKVSGYDLYEADLYWDSEFTTKRRNIQVMIDDLKET